MKAGEELILTRENWEQQLKSADVQLYEWYQLYFTDDPNEVSHTQAFIDGDFWRDGDEDQPVCHLHIPTRIIKLEQ